MIDRHIRTQSKVLHDAPLDQVEYSVNEIYGVTERVTVSLSVPYAAQETA
jgi:hypothetical protein